MKKSLSAQLSALFVMLLFLGILCPDLSAQSGNPVQQMRKKAKPGKSHALLDSFVGKWKIRMQYRIRPDMNPETAVGKAEFRWILGKRFLEQTVDGKGAIGPYKGQGIIGYDNVMSQYTGTWIDTMNSAIAKSIGNVEPDAKTFRFQSTTSDALTGKERTLEAVFQIINKDELRYSMFAKHPETGEQVAILIINYKRK